MKLDDEIVADYAITYVDDYIIHVKDTQHPERTIVASVNVPLEKSMIQMCQHIIDEKIVVGQGTAHVSWSADIRFDKQIIISSQKGGACHG